MFAQTKIQLIIILFSYLNIQFVKTLNSNNSFIDEYCVNQWPDLLTCVSNRELDIKAIFDELADSQQTPPSFYLKLVWKAPLINGEIPSNAFTRYGAKIVEFSANNLERVHFYAFIQTDDSQKIFSWKFLPDEIKLKNYPDGIYDLYNVFTDLSSLEELSLNLDWDSKHEIPKYAFYSTIGNNWKQMKNISFDGKFIISRIGGLIIPRFPPSFNKIIFNMTSIEKIDNNLECIGREERRYVCVRQVFNH